MILERSSDYRKRFFEKHIGFSKHHYYFCSYCGIIHSQKNITVDHLVPIYKAKNSFLTRLYLKLCKIEDINHIKNLVPACKRCNSRKGSKTGFWVILGTIGRVQWLWFIRHFIRLGLVAYFIYLAFIADVNKLLRIDDFLSFLYGG